MPNSDTSHEMLWYALSAPYRREFIASALLEKAGVEYFLPLTYQLVVGRSGRKERRLVPAVRNLIFAYTTRERLLEIKQGQNALQFKTRPMEGKNVPIVVPEAQMRDFIAVCRQEIAQMRFLNCEELALKRGVAVRIVGGPMDGVRGQFLKVKGARSRRLVVEIEGLAAVAVEVSPDWVEVISE